MNLKIIMIFDKILKIQGVSGKFYDNNAKTVKKCKKFK